MRRGIWSGVTTGVVAIVLAVIAMGQSQPQEVSLQRSIERGEMTDLLHGFSARLPKGWEVKVLSNAIRVSDERALCFVVLRVARSTATCTKSLNLGGRNGKR